MRLMGRRVVIHWNMMIAPRLQRVQVLLDPGSPYLSHFALAVEMEEGREEGRTLQCCQ